VQKSLSVKFEIASIIPRADRPSRAWLPACFQTQTHVMNLSQSFSTMVSLFQFQGFHTALNGRFEKECDMLNPDLAAQTKQGDLKPSDPKADYRQQGREHWAEISAALNLPVDAHGQSDTKVAHQIADLAKDAKTTTDPVKLAKDMGELQAALKAMRGNPDSLNGTLAEADKLLEGTGLKIAQTKDGEVWEGEKQADGSYKPKTQLTEATDPAASGPAAHGPARPVEAAHPSADDTIPRVESYQGQQQQHRRDEAVLNGNVEGSKSDEKAAKRIADLAKKIEAERAQEGADRLQNPENKHIPPSFRTQVQLYQELRNVAAGGDSELVNGTLAAANKLLEQDGLKFAQNEGRIVEGKKYPGHEASGYLFKEQFDLQALKYQ
jgi:hypothetical protein